MLKTKHLRHPLRTLRLAYDQYSSLLYDWRRGIRTTAIEPLAAMELACPENLAHASPYTPSLPEDIRAVFRHLEVDFREYTFVDIGCGKGRVLAEAVRYPFRAVIGIDFAKELCEASRRNLESVRAARRCGDVQVLHADATEWELPPTPAVVYIYNPFRGPVLAATLERIRKSAECSPRHIRIAYVAPIFPECFLAVPGIGVFKNHPRFVLYDLGPAPPVRANP